MGAVGLSLAMGQACISTEETDWESPEDKWAPLMGRKDRMRLFGCSTAPLVPAATAGRALARG